MSVRSVGILALHFRPGLIASSEPHLIRLTRALVAHGSARYTIYARTDNWKSFDLPQGAARYVLFPGALCQILGVRVMLEMFVVPIVARLQGIELLHYTGSTVPLIRLTKVVAMIHWVPTPVLLQAFSPVKRAYFMLIHSRIVRACDALVTPSAAARDAALAALHVDDSRLYVVPFGIEPRFFRAAPIELAAARATFGLPRRYILTVTSDAPYKDLGLLLNAFAAVRDSYSGSLVIAGDVSQRSLGAHAGSRKIRLLGFVPYQYMPGIMSGADALLYVSRQETFGLAIVEALAAGVPVIASDIPALREIGANAAHFVPRDVRRLSRAIERVLGDAAYADAMRARGFERARHFTWTAAAARMRSVYERALAQ